MLAGFLEFVMGIVFSNAASFGYPTAISVVFVFLAACLFSWYAATAPPNEYFDADEVLSERSSLVKHAAYRQQKGNEAESTAVQTT